MTDSFFNIAFSSLCSLKEEKIGGHGNQILQHSYFGVCGFWRPLGWKSLSQSGNNEHTLFPVLHIHTMYHNHYIHWITTTVRTMLKPTPEPNPNPCSHYKYIISTL